MSDVRTIRSSSMPLAMECPGSIQPTTILVDPVSEPANEGNAGHAVMCQIGERDATSLDGIDIVEIARVHKVDPDDLRPIAYSGLAFWKLIRASFQNAQGEVELKGELADGLTLTGHIDLLAMDGSHANIADWKFGRVDKNYGDQVYAYAALVFQNYPAIETVHASVCWMREKEHEPYSITHAQSVEWEQRVTERLLKWDGVYHPNPGCVHCKRSVECPALTAMARRDVAILTGAELTARIEAGLAGMAASELIDLHRRAKMIAKVCKSLDEAVHLRVDQAGGTLADEHGSELRYVETKKREIDPLKAWPVITERLSDQEMTAALKVSASKLDDLVAKKAGKGKGAAAVRDLEAALEKAHALTVVPSRQLRDFPSRQPRK